MKNSPRRFLKDELKLHQDPSLKKQAQIRNTINASDPNSIIGTLMDKYQNAIVQSLDDETRPLEKVRAFLYEKALLKEKDIPESYRDLQAKILRNNGQGAELKNGKFPQHARAAQSQLLINDQKERLSTWFDYLASSDAHYPIELKYWALRSLIKLETFDKERGKFPKRSKNSVANFPELNHEALALLMDTQTAKIAGRALRNPGLNEEDFATFQKAKSFADLYALCLKASLKENKE